MQAATLSGPQAHAYLGFCRQHVFCGYQPPSTLEEVEQLLSNFVEAAEELATGPGAGSAAASPMRQPLPPGQQQQAEACAWDGGGTGGSAAAAGVPPLPAADVTGMPDLLLTHGPPELSGPDVVGLLAGDVVSGGPAGGGWMW
jgi:hypothetical protein